jgi:hypothetical protein
MIKKEKHKFTMKIPGILLVRRNNILQAISKEDRKDLTVMKILSSIGKA